MPNENTNLKTFGISPKVYVPAIASLVAGVVLLALGYDVEGRSLIAAAVGTGLLGSQAKPGDVRRT